MRSSICSRKKRSQDGLSAATDSSQREVSASSTYDDTPFSAQRQIKTEDDPQPEIDSNNEPINSRRESSSDGILDDANIEFKWWNGIITAEVSRMKRRRIYGSRSFPHFSHIFY
ncbi:MAG: hypothetical protein K6B42_03625 [Clostridia bacterium]|nr:hypothetical protein [Clostridia bacterium]